MTPLFTSPCDLAERMPTLAAEFLELETTLGRRFREDSVTDIIIASLLTVGSGNATVFTPPEVKTGGDFDIVISQPGTGDSVQYRIQSKRLIPHRVNWAWSSYRELDHPHGSGKQASTLIRSSAQEKIPTIPLYAFYNPFSVCSASQNEISGIQLADGRAISAIVRALVKARSEGRRPRWKRVEYLQHLFFPLSTILCPPADSSFGENQIIEPEVSRQAALTAIRQRRIPSSEIADAPSIFLADMADERRSPKSQPAIEPIDLPVGPSHTSKRRNIPKIIERAIHRQSDEPPIQRARIKRPKIVLISR